METEDRKKRLYSAPAKVTVTVLLFLGALLCTIFGSAFLRLATLGSGDPTARMEGGQYYTTAGCAIKMHIDLSQLSDYLSTRKVFDVNGQYDPTQLVDVTKDYHNGITGVEVNKYTSYTLEDMYQMYVSGCADNLDANADESTYIQEDEALASESSEAAGYGLSGDRSDLTVASGSESEELVPQADLENIALEYMSEDTWKHLQSVGNSRSYSRQFLYLYGCGYPNEISYGIKTAAGSTLADYAAANPEKVSLYDLYRALPDLASQVSSYVWAEESQEQYLGRNSNLRYYVKDETQVYTNMQDWEALSEEVIQNMLESWPMYVSYTRENGRMVEGHFPETAAGYRLSSYLASEQILSGNERVYIGLDTAYPIDDDYKEAARFYDSLAPYAPGILAIAIIGLVMAIAAFVICTIQAGRNQKDGTVRLYGFDSLPTEVAMAVGVILGILLIGYFGYIIAINMSDMSGFFMVFLGLYVCMSVGLFMLFYLSLVRRIKAHNLWEKSILRAVIHLGGRVYEARQESSKLIMAALGLMLLHFIFLPTTGFFGVMLCLVVDILVLLYMLREATGKRTVIEGLRQLGSGDLDYKVDTTELKGNNKELAEVVNSMGDGLKTAVEVRMKNERMQADLITNVSHDIKTPLTSIVNYVDLLKRENIEDPKIKGYIDILERKSQRLKQLTEDLVEASKASSGNVNMEFVTLNLNELVQQVNGEFDERLSGRELDMICSLPPEPALVRADSRYLWRVIENLYGNVAKYAMPGSRVYVDVIRREGSVVFIMKNMSEQTLNISPDELMERFVRGDSSRTTEGSGLGLSIAENLVKLMKGTFELFVDGDLFKVEVTFPEVNRDVFRQSV